MPDQQSEPNVRLEGFIDPQPHQQSQELPNIEPVQGDLSAFAAKVVEEGLRERKQRRRGP
jgi:hypothetical protein